MVVDNKELNNIRDNYSKVWEWMKHKANWEYITMGAVLDYYKDYIEELKSLYGRD